MNRDELLAAAMESLRAVMEYPLADECMDDETPAVFERAKALLAAYDALPEEKGEMCEHGVSDRPCAICDPEEWRRKCAENLSRTPPSGSAEGRESGSDWLRVLKAYTDVGMKIEQRFKSGNATPVERAHITADEWATVNAYDLAVEDSMTTMAWEVGLLRQALVRAGNATDGGVSDECSSEFLSHVGEEVELCIAKLRKQLADDTTVRVPREPTEHMLESGVAFALNVKLGGEYQWTAYMRDLWAHFLIAAAQTEGGGE